jgi:hypothetical protein
MSSDHLLLRVTEKPTQYMGEPRVRISGGGFGGMYAALQFKHTLARGGEQYRQPNPQVVTSCDTRGTLPFVTLRSPDAGPRFDHEFLQPSRLGSLCAYDEIATVMPAITLDVMIPFLDRSLPCKTIPTDGIGQLPHA